jgi:hypothetical protein
MADPKAESTAVTKVVQMAVRTVEWMVVLTAV